MFFLRVACRRKLLVTTMAAVWILTILTVPAARADNLTQRRLELGTSAPGANTTHTFSFTITTSSSIGSLEFEYCSNDPFVGTPCTAPNGLDVSGAIVGSQLGETSFSVHPSTTVNRIVLGRTASVAVPGQVEYVFTNVINTSDPATTTYVRIATFTSEDGSGARTDIGALAFSTSGSLGVSAFVPPYLRFCVGITVSTDCLSFTGSYVNLGTLSPSEANTATSQMGAYTNDETGYVITALGTTMTSGNNSIPALTTETASQPGTAQFGINLRANTSPVVGSEPQGAGTGVPVAGYGTINQFKYVSGDTLASSPLPTEPNVFTVSYLVNVTENQSPGVYSTTLTYVGTAQF